MKKENSNPEIATETPELFTEAEAAKKLRISRITLQRARLAGKIAFVRIGGKSVFYTDQHLQDYLTAQTRKPLKPSRSSAAV